MTRETGLTLLELTVVLAILALLAGVLIPVALAGAESTKVGATVDELRVLRTALRRRYHDAGAFPGTLAELADPVDPEGSSPGERPLGPYVAPRYVGDEEDPWDEDAWFRAYDYDPTAVVHPRTGAAVGCRVTSAGPDGTQGTSDDIGILVLATDLHLDRARTETVRELRAIGGAIDAYYRLLYNAGRDPEFPALPGPTYDALTDDAPGDFPTLLSELVAAGLLPDDPDLETDGLGADYEIHPDTVDGGPGVIVRSTTPEWREGVVEVP